ncbi:MAG: 50S ribosomal protein L25 [Peptostreptococcaceae bacterium]|nr:50S ribosomal protein L25 [Peptostreptococcaceae bacterium]
MKDIILIAEKRETGSTTGLKKLRVDGMVPAMVYGKHSENRAIKLLGNEIKRFNDSMAPGSSMNIKIGEEEILVIIKELQRDAVKRNVIHIDFQELTEGEKIKVKIPVHVFNRSAVEIGNKVVQQQLQEIEIETLPKYLIQTIEVDCKLLNDTDAITVADLPIYSNADIEVFEDPDDVVVSLVTVTRAEVETEEVEEVAEIEEKEEA